MSMKNFLIILLGFYFSSRAQISITTNFPEKIALNFDFDLEIKIFKGPVKNYSKYEIQVPQGIDIKEGDSKSGTFSFEQNKAKLIWAIIIGMIVVAFNFSACQKEEVGGPSAGTPVSSPENRR